MIQMYPRRRGSVLEPPLISCSFATSSSNMPDMIIYEYKIVCLRWLRLCVNHRPAQQRRRLHVLSLRLLRSACLISPPPPLPRHRVQPREATFDRLRIRLLQAPSSVLLRLFLRRPRLPWSRRHRGVITTLTNAILTRRRWHFRRRRCITSPTSLPMNHLLRRRHAEDHLIPHHRRWPCSVCRMLRRKRSAKTCLIT